MGAHPEEWDKKEGWRHLLLATEAHSGILSIWISTFFSSPEGFGALSSRSAGCFQHLLSRYDVGGYLSSSSVWLIPPVDLLAKLCSAGWVNLEDGGSAAFYMKSISQLKLQRGTLGHFWKQQQILGPQLQMNTCESLGVVLFRKRHGSSAHPTPLTSILSP